MELFRSLLFVPASRPRFIEKAPTVGADAICIDLEDAVAPNEKANAREVARTIAPTMPRHGHQLYIRVNGLDTGLLEADIDAVISAHIDGISLPKAHTPAIVQQVDHYLSLLEATRGLPQGYTKMVLWIESAQAVLGALDVLRSSPRIVGAAFGGEDYTADMGIHRTADAKETFWARTMVAVACRAAGVLPIDQVEPNFTDMEQFRAQATLGKSIGYRAKFCIHPSQVPATNDVFGPAPEEIVWAQRVVAVYDESVTAGLGAVSLDGEMIDRPIYLRAQKMLDWAAQLKTASGGH